jgi:hypothetical protein
MQALEQPEEAWSVKGLDQLWRVNESQEVWTRAKES